MARKLQLQLKAKGKEGRLNKLKRLKNCFLSGERKKVPQKIAKKKRKGEIEPTF